ncbi:MAG: site-2 protease family protein [Alphaproteobacteria bacterium]
MGEGLLYKVSVWAVPVLLAITLHEAAHGFAAWRLGDPTAQRLGRVSLNPFRHIDLFGTILLPALLLFLRAPFMFGWAKPVPVVFRNLRNPRRGMVLVAAAGPAMNLLLAFLSALLLHTLPLIPGEARGWMADTVRNSILLNLVLAAFNMLPLPPLDGGRVAVGLLPAPLARPLARLERYGMAILIGALILLPLLARQLGTEFRLFEWIIGGAVAFLWQVIGTLAGVR